LGRKGSSRNVNETSCGIVSIDGMAKRAVSLAVMGVAMLAFGGIRAPGKYNGVVIFDRWDTCYLYSGGYLMYISEKVKESLRPYRGQAMLIDAQKVEQFSNPGDGLISKFTLLGPAVEPLANPPGLATPSLDGLALHVTTDFSRGDQRLVIDLRNRGNVPKQIDTDALAPTIFMKRQEGVWIWGSASDGASEAAVTRINVDFLTREPWRMTTGRMSFVISIAAPRDIAISRHDAWDRGALGSRAQFPASSRRISVHGRIRRRRTRGPRASEQPRGVRRGRGRARKFGSVAVA
jgi:hypothetical protein